MIRVYTKEQLTEEIDRLEKDGYKAHHSAWSQGYISRKCVAEIIPYAGRYGTGFVVHEPSHISTQNHRITYYVK